MVTCEATVAVVGLVVVAGKLAPGSQLLAVGWLGGGGDYRGPMLVVVMVSIYGENGGVGCSGFARSLSGPFVPCLRGSSFVRSWSAAGGLAAHA